MSNPSEDPQQSGAQPPPPDPVPPAGPGQPPAVPGIRHHRPGTRPPRRGTRPHHRGTRAAGVPGAPARVPGPTAGVPGTPGYQAQPGYQAPRVQAHRPGTRPTGVPGPPPGTRGSRRLQAACVSRCPRTARGVLAMHCRSAAFPACSRWPPCPPSLKVSYWIWLIGGLLGLLGGIIGLFGSFVLIAFAPPLGLLVLVLVLVALVLATAQIILAMKMKEGREWARFALTIIAGISLVLALINAGVADGRGGGNLPASSSAWWRPCSCGCRSRRPGLSPTGAASRPSALRAVRLPAGARVPPRRPSRGRADVAPTLF